MEAAKARRMEANIDIDEQNITEAILEAAQAIAKSTAVLVNSATQVQQEFQKLVKEPQTRSVYKRDPQWAEGLISAARTVAGAVQHLVKASNEAAQGKASEEALVVAAKAVAASTTQLVTASRVKADPNSQSQVKLGDAAKMVTQATQQLVEAARQAAEWEEEKVKAEEAEKYSLADTKIKEMEKQMEILRLEKELSRAREALGSMRQKDYDDNKTQDFNPQNRGPQPGPRGPPMKGPVPMQRPPQQQVPWKTNVGAGQPPRPMKQAQPGSPPPVPRQTVG
jgi:talin